MLTDGWEDEARAFVALDRAGRAEWLARLAFALTIAARDTYVVGGEDLTDGRRMRQFNELQHRVTSHLVDQLVERRGRSDEDLMRTVRGYSGDLGLGFGWLKSLMGR